MICMLFVCIGVSVGQDILSVDTQFVSSEPSVIDLINRGREVLTSPPSIDMYYVYLVSLATFILGILRRLVPKWEWIQNMSLDKIPRSVTVAVMGIAVVIFIVRSGFANVGWEMLLGSVFGTMGLYTVAKDLVKKIPDNLSMIRTVLLLLLGRYEPQPKS